MKTRLQIIDDYLRRFYDGESTPAENAMLTDMLHALDDSELTPRLRDERDFLDYMAGAGGISEPEMPADLERRILEATVGQTGTRNHGLSRSARFLVIRGMCGLAYPCVGYGLVVHGRRRPRDSEPGGYGSRQCRRCSG